MFQDEIFVALTNCKLWVLDRNVFQVIMMRSGLQRQQEIVSFLRSVPDLKNLSEEKLAKIGDALEVRLLFFRTSVHFPLVMRCYRWNTIRLEVTSYTKEKLAIHSTCCTKAR